MIKPPLSGEPAGERRTARTVTTEELADQTGALLDAGYRLALVTVQHDRPGGSPARVVYLFLATGPDRRVELRLPLSPGRLVVPTLAELSVAAGRFEREMQDRYGIDPVGPTRAGPGAPGRFRFPAVGAAILELHTRLWFRYKGAERLFEGREVAAGLPLAERIAGDTSVGHALSYCRAVEEALGLTVPEDARRMRAILLELERLYNHVTDIGALCGDSGRRTLEGRARRVREDLLRLNADTTGHRLLRGGILIGGAAIRAVPDPDRLAAIGAETRDLTGSVLDRPRVAERFGNTAVLSPTQAREVGALGYVARASGVDTDARRDHPTGILGDFGLELGDILTVPTQAGGDVLARFRQRGQEIDASLAVLDTLVRAINPGHIQGWPSPDHRRPAAGASSGVGIAEGWRGTIVHRVDLDAGHRIARAKVVDPSFFNWPALPIALADTVVADFPLASRSFNLSHADSDR